MRKKMIEEVKELCVEALTGINTIHQEAGCVYKYGDHGWVFDEVIGGCFHPALYCYKCRHCKKQMHWLWDELATEEQEALTALGL